MGGRPSRRRDRQTTWSRSGRVPTNRARSTASTGRGKRRWRRARGGGRWDSEPERRKERIGPEEASRGGGPPVLQTRRFRSAAFQANAPSSWVLVSISVAQRGVKSLNQQTQCAPS